MPFTQNTSPTFAKQPRHGVVNIANADASNLKTIVTAGANGSKVLSVYASSSDSSARDVQLGVSRAGTFYPILTMTVPVTAGQGTGIAPIDFMANTTVPSTMFAFDHDGRWYINLESGDTLDAKALTTVTAAKLVSLQADYEDF